MRQLFVIILAGVLLCAFSLAQQDPSAASMQASQAASQPSTQPAANEAPRIAPGSVIPVQLTESVDAKKIKSGDEVDAKVTQDLKSGSGALIVPKDTKVVGHVTEAQARTKDQKESQVGILFDHAVMKNGGVVQLPLSIQAIISPQALSSGNNSAEPNPDQQSPALEPGGMAGSAGRPGAMGSGSAPPRAQSPVSPSSEIPPDPGSAGAKPTITANTQGVVGISDMKLSTAGEAAQGSVVSSDKKNVKLENGTLMLLRVNQ